MPTVVHSWPSLSLIFRNEYMSRKPSSRGKAVHYVGTLSNWHPASRAFSYGTYALYREKDAYS